MNWIGIVELYPHAAVRKIRLIAMDEQDAIAHMRRYYKHKPWFLWRAQEGGL
jgi:hypothetical protein